MGEHYLCDYVQNLFSDSTLFKIQDVILHKIKGCKECCPACGVNCEKMENHEGPCYSDLHRIQGVKGTFWTNNNKLITTHNCNKCYEQEHTLHLGGLGGEVVPYRNFKSRFNWDLTEYITKNSQQYWQYYIFEYEKYIKKNYDKDLDSDVSS